MRLVPEAGAEIHIKTDRQAPGASCFAGFFAGGSTSLPERWCNPAKMKPFGAVEDRRPVEHAGPAIPNGSMLAIVGDFGGATAGARFHEINPQALASALDGGSIDAARFQRSEATISEVVFREAADEGGGSPELRKLNGGIGFGAA